MKVSHLSVRSVLLASVAAFSMFGCQGSQSLDGFEQAKAGLLPPITQRESIITRKVDRDGVQGVETIKSSMAEEVYTTFDASGQLSTWQQNSASDPTAPSKKFSGPTTSPSTRPSTP